VRDGIERGRLERFRTAVARRLGLLFDDGKLDYLAEVLGRRLEQSGVEGCAAYLDRLSSPAGWHEEWRALAGDLTVGETYFFRYRDHFRAFTEAVLPVLVQDPPGRLRILSAGCASGDEAFTLAILVREQLPALAAGGQVTIRGLDVNPAAIERARAGRYSPWALREMPPAFQERYFRSRGRELILDEAVRAMVSFEERNLVDDDAALWPAAACDAVFCRNVLMYLSPDAACRVVAGIARTLRPGGFLFLGHAENLRGVSEAFHLRHTHDAFYYQLREDAGRAFGVEAGSTTATPPRPGAIATPPPLPWVAADGSWVETIRRASARIATLAADIGRGPAAAGEADRGASGEPAEVARRDLASVLELLREERFDDALAQLHGLPAESRDDPDAQLLRAALLTNAGSLTEAEAACRELLETDELSAGAHYLMSLCREHAGDRAGAVDHDQTAIYLDPAFAMPRLHLGLVAKRARDLDTARRELSSALSLLPREDASRILMFGGGFSREALVELARSELALCGGPS
jgi:chemotaxis protein methyltransferase CheR